MAAIFAELLGKPVAVVDVDPESQAGALMEAGVPADAARLYAEMNVGIANGQVSWENPNQVRRGVVAIKDALAALI